MCVTVPAYQVLEGMVGGGGWDVGMVLLVQVVGDGMGWREWRLGCRVAWCGSGWGEKGGGVARMGLLTKSEVLDGMLAMR